jgi:23S rRNA (cytidine1920-2'-O)/16S rRNA (cytidine1409-2'-O)-methyltransferase
MRQRLDVLVVERGLLPSRQAARAAIMEGFVLVNGEKVTKPGQNIDILARLELIPSFKTKKFVSRGGLKLEKAISEFHISVKDRICLDIGASTGGFTDCLLQHGAIKVYAVDVGYGQFDWRLRNDLRVVLKERQNVRHLTSEELYGKNNDQFASLAVVDLSFISLKLVLPDCHRLISKENAEMICLIKPQFEVGKGKVGKGGVVRSVKLQVEAIDQVLQAASALNLAVLGLTHSPVLGPAGNIEFLLYLKRDLADKKIIVQDIVEDARSHLLASRE